MVSVQGAEKKAQDIQARVMSVVKVGALVVTTGTGAGVSVRGILFANWEMVAPLAEGSTFGMVLVATLATLATFVVSGWMCLVAGCFSSAIAALSPVKKERITCGAAAQARRARRLGSRSAR